nr:reverse transcriptase domain, reverse transcriptase zinc-binding domain protein [Tanacetum cinerariifolium]
MLNHMVRQLDSFTFHRYCLQLNIINLYFKDDLFLFAHGDVDLAHVIMKALEEYKNASGLTPSLPKSTAYFCNVLNYVKISILGILLFEEGTLPVKHFCVPLVPSRLLYRDCSELMERIKRRINDWKNKSLSFAGRTKLIRSMLGSIHLYWALVFILPSRRMLELEQVLRGFFWCQAADGISWLTVDNLDGDFSVAKVWEHLKHFTCISNIPSDLNSIMYFITPMSKTRLDRSIIFRHVFAASCYFIWQERNFRLFKKTKMTHEQVIEAIKNTVRLKLLSCSFKKTLNVMSLLQL